MVDVDVTFGAVDLTSSTSTEITIYEDTSGDGNADNQATQTLSAGTTSYTLSGFGGGGDLWFDLKIDEGSDLTAGDIVTAPVDINYATTGNTLNAPVVEVNADALAPTVDAPTSLNASVQTLTVDDINPTVRDYEEVVAPVASVASSSPTPTINARADLNAPVASISSSTPTATVDAVLVQIDVTAAVLDSTTPAFTIEKTLLLTAPSANVATSTPPASTSASGTAPIGAPVDDLVLDTLVDTLIGSGVVSTNAPVAVLSSSTPPASISSVNSLELVAQEVETTTPTLEATPRGSVEVQANVENVDVTTPALVATGSSAVSFSAPPAVIQSASPFVTVEFADRLDLPALTISSSTPTNDASVTGSGATAITTSKDEGGTGAAEVEVLAPTPNRLVRILVAPLETVSYGLSGDGATASLSFGKPPESRRQPIFNKKDERETRASIGGNEEQVSSRSPNEPADIEVRIVDTVSPIPDGGTSDVTVEVRNTTASQKTETVELNVDSQDVTNPVDSTSVTVDSRSRKEITLTWDAFDGAAGTNGKTYDVTASSPNDSDTGQVEVLPTVSGVEYRPTILGTNSPLTSEAGEETAEVDVRFTNFGDSDGTNEPVFLDAWEQDATDEVDLDLASGASKEVTLTWDVPYYLDAGEYNVTARGEPESDIPDQTVRDRVTDSTNVEVRRDDPIIPEPEGTLEVTITGTNSPVNEGEPASVNVDVVNTGGEPESGTIVLANRSYGSGYGQDVGYANVDEVAPNGGVETIAVVWATQDGDVGDHDLTVRSGCANGVNDDESIDIPNDDCADETTVTVEETDGATTPWALNVTLDGVESPIGYRENATVVANITHVGNVSMSGISKLTITGQGRNDVGVDVSGLNLGQAETVRKTFEWNASAGFEPPSGGSEDFEACVEVWRDGTADPPDDVACSTITVGGDTYALTQSATARNDTVGSAEATVETVPAGYEEIRYSWSFDDDGAPGRSNQRVWELKYDGSAIETKIWSSDEYVSAGGTETIPLPDTNGGDLVLRANDGKATIGPP